MYKYVLARSNEELGKKLERPNSSNSSNFFVHVIENYIFKLFSQCGHMATTLQRICGLETFRIEWAIESHDETGREREREKKNTDEHKKWNPFRYEFVHRNQWIDHRPSPIRAQVTVKFLLEFEPSRKWISNTKWNYNLRDRWEISCNTIAGKWVKNEIEIPRETERERE